MEDVKAKSGQGMAIASVVVLTIEVVGLLVIGGVTLLARAGFAKLFADMKVELPALTQFLLSIPTAAYVGVFLPLIIFLVLKETLIRAKTVTLIINLVVGCGAVAYLIVYVTALFLPMIELMTNMQGP